MKIIKKIIRILITTVLIFLLMVVRLFSVRIYDIEVQKRHMKDLNAMYASYTTPIDDQQFADFDISSSHLKLNEIQYLATHNSYKGMSTPLGRFFVGLGDSFQEARALKYSYKTLTEQLKSGIRSMELDVRYRKQTFILNHVPLVDNSSVAPNLALALEEINLYMTYNPNHMPIILIFEMKDDWMMLDPMLKPMDNDVLVQFNDLIKNVFGDKLYSPNDLRIDNLSINDTIKTHGWPEISSLLGKIICVMHPSSINQTYRGIDFSSSKQALFSGSYKDDIEHDDTSFIIHNDIDVASIESLVQMGYIVRTRMDESLIYKDEQRLLAISSGAHILSSDFTIGRKDLSSSLIIDLNGFTMIRRL